MSINGQYKNSFIIIVTGITLGNLILEKLLIPSFGCRYLVNQGCIKPLCDLLVFSDPRIVTVCLEGLENILKVWEAQKVLGNTGGVNLYAQYNDDVGGLEKIENLQSHDTNEIYEKLVNILENYWPEDDEDDQTINFYLSCLTF